MYSKSAEANYGSYNIFDGQITRIPAKRLCNTEEVSVIWEGGGIHVYVIKSLFYELMKHIVTLLG